MCQIDYQYLRPKKADALRKWYDHPFSERSELEVWHGENATIFPLREIPNDTVLFGRGGVLDSDGIFVELSALPHRVQYSYPINETTFRDEKVVYCGYLIHHWGHFLVEAVTRLWYFLENDSTIDKYVFILKEHEQREVQGNFREFFQLLNIWDKLEFISEPTVYREVVVPEMAFQVRNYYSPKFIKLFDVIASNAALDSAWVPSEKIYLSRGQLKKNSLYEFGFESLDNLFLKNGYTILHPEKLSLSQLIFYIRNAKDIASISGTLPHNMLFANSGQTVTILERCVINNEFQVHVNQLRNLNAHYIDANIPVYIVSMAGPYIMGYNRNVEKFASDRHFQPPDKKYCTEKYLKQCFVNYMKRFNDMYRYHWYVEEWYLPYMDYLTEAYHDGMTYFGDYLNGSKPFLPEHYFQWHYWKQFVKRVLRKVGLR